MRQFGIYVLIFGAGSMLLNLFGYEFRLLSWIDNWGEGVGWGIRIGLIVLGAILFFLGKPNEEGEALDEQAESKQPENKEAES